MKSIAIFISILSLPCSLYVDAASFNCEKAKTPTEIRVCANDDLSKLDDELNIKYREALKNIRNSSKLKKEEIAWIKSLNACGLVSCLIKKYNARINELDLFVVKNTEKNNEVREVDTPVTTAKNATEIQNPIINSVGTNGVKYHCFGVINSEVYNAYYPENPVRSIESTPNRDSTNDTFTFFKDRMSRVMLLSDMVAKALNLSDKKQKENCPYKTEKMGVISCTDEHIAPPIQDDDATTKYYFDKNLPPIMTIKIISEKPLWKATSEYTDCRRS